MTVTREQLMRYHDGELSPSEARVVEAAIEQTPSLLEELDAYSELGSFVRAWDQSSASKHAAFDVTESVMSALEPPRARVHSLLPRIATWVSLGAAIAAGSVLVVRSWSAPPVPPRSPSATQAEHSGLASPSASVPELSAVLAAAAEEEREPLPPATIESVDFGSNTGEVFVLSTDSSETPVVWMPDDGEPDDDNEDRSESL
ncbi:MAG TPA: zf-HC2 domain-containing protein [Polyangiaceae bacterium]|nr:zf-HC2 domain-containing protein [Polyangiaceae bacterium]